MREKEKERNLIENGGRMLEEFISSCDGRVNPIRMYSAAELEKAIGNTNPVWQDTFGDGNYYKGTYLGRTILIKKFKLNSNRTSSQRDQIFNEMAVLSQMKHRNVVKLLGCCLETKVPMLVYEFASNGILSDHIKDLSWEDRLRIAAQVADALTYMHTATGKPIVHRDIKPSTILLDDNYSPKIFELDLSITIPVGETHVEINGVTGTMHYLDPEQFRTRQVTEKCDVYSFGQLLVDLLSQTLPGDRMVDTADKVVDLVMSSIKDKLDASNWSKGKTDQSSAFAVLALRCLRRDGEERPTMKEVVQELRRIIRSSLETRNTTEMDVEEVLQELRSIIRSSLETRNTTEMDVEGVLQVLKRILSAQQFDLLTQTLPGDRMRGTVDEAIDWVMSSIKYKLDAGNWSQGKTEQLLAFAMIASRCPKLEVEERPTMKEVVQELRRIIRYSLEIRNTTETNNVSMEEVLQELRRVLRSCLEP